jgi:2-dehydro-3-deoxyphosphooctonate aldolase (KDO 8-P synthase)
MDDNKVTVPVGNFSIGAHEPLTVIAGPCQIENKSHALMMASLLKKLCAELDVNFIYKSSFDKANRTSISTQRGVGIHDGLKILAEIKAELDIPVLTDIHHPEHAGMCEFFGIDVVQIPAFLSRQTDLLIAAGKTPAVVNIKKGQFMAPNDIVKAAEKVASTGNQKILLCERGVTHGYNNLVVDMRSLPIMARSGYPVVFDCTHSVQQPGGLGTSTGGDRGMVPYLARAAVATGSVNALFIETHEAPDSAPSDGPNMVPLSKVRELILQCKSIHDQVAAWPKIVL